MTRWTFTRGGMGIALSPDVSIKPMRHGTEAGEHLNQRDMSGGGASAGEGGHILLDCTKAGGRRAELEPEQDGRGV